MKGICCEGYGRERGQSVGDLAQIIYAVLPGINVFRPGADQKRRSNAIIIAASIVRRAIKLSGSEVTCAACSRASQSPDGAFPE